VVVVVGSAVGVGSVNVGVAGSVIGGVDSVVVGVGISNNIGKSGVGVLVVCVVENSVL